MESVIAKGKTIKEAIQKGLELLNLSDQEVHVEIIQPEAKEFWGMVKVNSTLRGGKVYAELGADIHRAGSDSGTATFIEVPEDQKICIETAMERTTIKVGSKKHTFKETIRQVTAALDPSGRLMLE